MHSIAGDPLCTIRRTYIREYRLGRTPRRQRGKSGAIRNLFWVARAVHRRIPFCVAQSPLLCRDRYRLEDAYHNAVHAYVTAVMATSDVQSSRSNELWDEVARCRQVWQEARSALEQHLKDHGCGNAKASEG